MALLTYIRRLGWRGMAAAGLVLLLLLSVDCGIKGAAATEDGQGDSAPNETNPPSALDMQEGPVDQLHSVSERDKNVFLSAAITGDLPTVQKIVNSGGSPETHNVLGWTPLNLAALAGRVEVVRFLILHASADRETREIYGQTPLGSASINGHIEVVRFLLNLNPMANVSARDLDGATPLHYAAQFGYADVCKELLQKGADPNAVVPQNGWTPLHAAAAAGQVEAVRILLEFQADKEHRDSDGNKPSQIVGLTMPVTKRKMKQIQCLLDPEAVFGGCGESNQENNGHEQGQNHDESQNYQQGGWTEPPSFYPVHIPPGENLDEVINGSNQTRNEG